MSAIEEAINTLRHGEGCSAAVGPYRCRCNVEELRADATAEFDKLRAALADSRRAGFMAGQRHGIERCIKELEERASDSAGRAMEKHREGNGTGSRYWSDCAEEDDECVALLKALPLSPEPEENKHQ